MTALPDWMRPPRAEGWYADDLDRLPEVPRHTELIDGALVFMMSPQRIWHTRMLTRLDNALSACAPEGIEVDREVTIRLDKRNRPEPDLVVHKAQVGTIRTWVSPEDVLLVVEVVSPESEHRDRTVKFRKYAETGIPHYWIADEEGGNPVVQVFELEEPAGAYSPAGTFRDSLVRTVPFQLTVDLAALPRLTK